MTEKDAKKIFEQYNRTADVIRCPNGRAIIRKLLDSYARAAVNLYGIISRKMGNFQIRERGRSSKNDGRIV